MFFALWPEEAVRKRLYHTARRLQAHCGGRPVPADRLHLTLAFLGEVAMERFGALDALARSVSARKFTLLLNRYGGWRRQRLVWAAPAEAPPLDALAFSLQQCLADNGFYTDARPFLPHVTLLRRADGEQREEDRIDPIYWKAATFVLVQSQRSRRGAAYQIVGRYALL